jgi:hypothetical protein
MSALWPFAGALETLVARYGSVSEPFQHRPSHSPEASNDFATWAPQPKTGMVLLIIKKLRIFQSAQQSQLMNKNIISGKAFYPIKIRDFEAS